MQFLFGRSLPYFLLFVIIHTQETFAQEPQHKIKIGALLTLSGNFASAGEDCRSGIQAALKGLGSDARIDIIFSDSKNEPSAAISELRKLTSRDNISAIFANRATIAMPLNPISHGLTLPLIAAAGHSKFVPSNPFAFQMWPSSIDEAAFLANQFQLRKHSKVAMIYSEDEWTGASASAFREALVTSGMKIVFDQSVPSLDTNFQTLLLKIKATRPDALYANLVLSQLAPFFRQAHNLNIEIPSYTNFYLAKPEVLNALTAEALKQVNYYDTEAELPALRKEATIDEGQNIPPLMVVSYLSTLLLNQAASESKGSSPKDFYDALLLQGEIRTADKDFSMVGRYLQMPLVLKSVKR